MSTSPSVVPGKTVLDEDDLYAWANRQAALLRARRLDEPDLDRKLEAAKEAGYSYGRDRASGETDIAIERFPEKLPYD